MPTKPLILVTNDDGIHAKGLHELYKIALQFGDVIVVAPDKPQSGMGHAITMGKPLRMKQVDLPNVEAWSTSGTPVDCVKLAVYKIMHRKPDLVLSGINHGANSSINVIYSGTMSAAVEGAVEGIKSIGFSYLDHDENADFSTARPFIEKIISNVLSHRVSQGACLNVNIPVGEIKGIRISRQAKAYWEDAFDERKDPMGTSYYWLTGEFVYLDQGEDTDIWALENHYISVVPTQFDMTAHRAIEDLNTWDL